jgi:hypothetical protein
MLTFAMMAAIRRKANAPPRPKKTLRAQPERAKPHPLVGSGNPQNSAAARTKTNSTWLYYRMVAVATHSPSHRSKSPHQTKITTVMLL